MASAPPHLRAYWRIGGKEMASLAFDKSGTTRLLFTDQTGKRRTIRLGKIDRQYARSFKAFASA